MADEKKQTLSDAIQRVKDLVTSGGEEPNSQLDAGDQIKDLLGFLSSTFPGAFEEKTPEQEELERRNQLTPAQKLFGDE